MTDKGDFDKTAAHKYFSVNCFNQAWDLIDKKKRTPEEDAEMVRLSLASHYHWTQRPDYSDTNASIALWQTARIYAILVQTENAKRYGQMCLEVSQKEGVPPFFLGYAYEALARAAAVEGDEQDMIAFLDKAKIAAENVQEADDRKMLVDDLETILIQ